jgi:hypothetical protein
MNLTKRNNLYQIARTDIPIGAFRLTFAPQSLAAERGEA